jgi:hypothetical protein
MEVTALLLSSCILRSRFHFISSSRPSRLELLRELVPLRSPSLFSSIRISALPPVSGPMWKRQHAHSAWRPQFYRRPTQAKLKQLSITSLKPALTPSWLDPVHFWTAIATFWWPALLRSQFQRHMKLARARWPAGSGETGRRRREGSLEREICRLAKNDERIGSGNMELVSGTGAVIIAGAIVVVPVSEARQARRGAGADLDPD